MVSTSLNMIDRCYDGRDNMGILRLKMIHFSAYLFCKRMAPDDVYSIISIYLHSYISSAGMATEEAYRKQKAK